MYLAIQDNCYRRKDDGRGIYLVSYPNSTSTAPVILSAVAGTCKIRGFGDFSDALSYRQHYKYYGPRFSIIKY